MKSKPINIKLLPNYYKKISLGLLALSIILIAVNKIFTLPLEKEIIREIGKIGVLVTLLM
ncbi:hypothetical protein LCGC14_3130260, partial [marine sediment metagenome]